MQVFYRAGKTLPFSSHKWRPYRAMLMSENAYGFIKVAECLGIAYGRTQEGTET